MCSGSGRRLPLNTRFVRVEREKLETLAAELQRAEGECKGLRRSVEELVASH